MFARDVRLFLKSLGYALVVGAVFLAVCAVWFFASFENGAQSKPMTLALVNEDGNEGLGGFVLSMVASNENISSAVEIEFFDSEEEAKEAVRQGSAAALILPKDFFASVKTGQNYPCTLILNRSDMAAADAIRTIADLGTDMLSSVQTAVYEGDLCLKEKGADDSLREEYNLRLNTAMISEISSAPEKYFRIKDLGYTTKGLSAEAHYYVLLFVFFLGVLSICFFHLYRDDCEKNILIRLFASGVSKFRFVLYKVLLPFALFSVLFFVVSMTQKERIGTFPNVQSILLAVCAIAFMAVFCAMFGISFGKSSGAILFIIFFVSLFLCGGIISYADLPRAALMIGELTPLGVTYAFLSPMFGGAFSLISLIPMAIYIAAGVYLTNRTLCSTTLGKEAI